MGIREWAQRRAQKSKSFLVLNLKLRGRVATANSDDKLLYVLLARVSGWYQVRTTIRE